MDQHTEPLASRLRNAALARADAESRRMGDVVLDDDGVIDLRALEIERARDGGSVADPAPVLSSMRGKFGDAAEVSDLYDMSEPTSPRWRLGRRARPPAETSDPPGAPTTTDRTAPPAPATGPAPTSRPTPPASRTPLSRISALPLADELPRHSPPATGTGAPTPSTADHPEIELREETRPTADCPQCAGLGRRDLFDRFSQIEFYSCDHCHHMWQQVHDPERG